MFYQNMVISITVAACGVEVKNCFTGIKCLYQLCVIGLDRLFNKRCNVYTLTKFTGM